MDYHPVLDNAGGMRTVLIAAAALLLDWLLGEPRRRHPLVGFGRLALCCPVLGIGSAPLAADVERALRLVRGGVWLWLASLCLGGALGA